MEKPISELLEFCMINIDKPAGMTSHDVVQKVKKILKADKAGHAGTLDPMVTGVLPILLNRACKLSNYFMKKDKKYIGKMYLHKTVSESDLKKEMDEFIGKIMQKPPVKSRVKRILREREVKKFKIIKKQGRIVEFESDVQAGTYIRKLISDLGEKIGGAHMIELRRIKAGIFKIENSYIIEQLQQALNKYKQGYENELREILIPAEIIKEIITSVQIKKESSNSLLNGRPLMKNDLKEKRLPNSKLLSVFYKKKFIGIYKRVNENEIIGKPEFVKN